jgi:hypothetical protein
MLMITGIGKEGNLARTGFLNGSNFMNAYVPIPDDLPSDYPGQFGECLDWRCHLFLVRPLYVSITLLVMSMP